MKRFTATLALAAAGLIGLGADGSASTFAAWTVANVPPGDLLNVRAYPSAGSRVLVGYPNGTVLSMTRRCTGGVDLDRVLRLAPKRQTASLRPVWCEVWLDPTGAGTYRSGWVRGRFIRPT